MVNWHSKTAKEIFAELKSSEDGLTTKETAHRLAFSGPNALPETKGDSLFLIFFRQFQSPLIFILLGAALVVFFLKENIDAAFILFVLLFNAVVGSWQEGKAQNTLLALKTFVKTSALVLREGKEFIIPDEEVVRGDIIILKEGGKIPADARVIEASNLKVDEASFTGESEPVHKITEPLANPELKTAEQRNMVFKGTHVIAGIGKAIVTATGLHTVIGAIAKKITTIDTEIPLKADIRSLSHLIIIAVAGISGVLFFIGIAMENTLNQMFTTVVSLSVSIIPEGLPIVLTLVLTSGVWRMAKRAALVKKISAVEALGQARILAIDKTGTLTKNEMMIQQVAVGGKLFEVSGSGYEPKGNILFKGKEIIPSDYPELLLAGRVAAFCANADISLASEENLWHIAGDPTEASLLVFAKKLGLAKGELENKQSLIEEIPFDYKTKYHATVHALNAEKAFLTLVGAPEKILPLSHYVWKKSKEQNLTKKRRGELDALFISLVSQGFRVLAFAFRQIPRSQTQSSDMFANLTFGGFYAMRDALRPGVKEALEKVKDAGIRVVMITGDHALTAEAVAKELGMSDGNGVVLTGDEIDSLSVEMLSESIPRVAVFARVTPEHKLKIIQAYKRRGEIIAMTGDGVNDAPSLVAADLGVAMGRVGTEVAKEAADIVLLDDNIESIVGAVEEGRSIYKTIKKVILYLFSTSVGETLTIGGALILGYPLPLLPAQILWLNLVTDGFLDVALAMEPKERGLLQGRFRRSRYLVDTLMTLRIIVMSLPMMIGTLLLFAFYLQYDFQKALTISLTTLAVFQWINAWNCRSEEKSIFKLNPFSNKFLVGATLIVIFLQLGAIYTPIGQTILRTTPLSLNDWLIIIPVAFSILVAEEVRKYIYGLLRH